MLVVIVTLSVLDERQQQILQPRCIRLVNLANVVGGITVAEDVLKELQ